MLTSEAALGSLFCQGLSGGFMDLGDSIGSGFGGQASEARRF